MLVNGYKLREAIKMKQLELSTIQSQFEESLHKFEGEEKESPFDVVNRIRKLENEVALLQTAQDLYNLRVMVSVGEEKMQWRLSFAIKAVGGAGRISKMWRNAAAGKKRDRWDRGLPVVKKTDEIEAEPTVTKQEALEAAKRAEKVASSIRSAIASGNAEEIDIDFITPELFS